MKKDMTLKDKATLCLAIVVLIALGPAKIIGTRNYRKVVCHMTDHNIVFVCDKPSAS